LPAASAAAAVLGHVFSIYLRFRGGKGVATAFGAMTALCWPVALGAGCLWGAVYLATRTVSIASLCAALALPVGVALWRTRFERETYPVVVAFAILLCILIFARHRGNIRRLLRGEELRFGGGRDAPPTDAPPTDAPAGSSPVTPSKVPGK
jgi:glycerol-3-phosphate acyltransferase PlsY